jgi:hypothetical protein
LDNSAQAEFPYRLNFNLSAESKANITDVRLRYLVDRVSYARVTSEIYIDVVPGPRVDVSWTWDMRKTGGLPTGSSVEYWWIIEDANGDRTETAPLHVQFDDTRYSWHSLTEDKVTIYWYEGRQSFAQELMAASRQAMNRLNKDTGAELKESVKLYIYTDAQDLRDAMIHPQEWTGGVAFPRYGTIAIGIATNNLNWGKRAIAHELSHLVIHQMTLNPYGGLPTWLNEGLAMYAEGKLSTAFTSSLSEAIAKDNLISVRSLSSPFSAYTEQSYLSYAQSYSLVDYLISNYGQGKMLELLNTFKEGSSYDNALVKVYDFDMDGLDTLWRDYLAVPSQPTEEEQGMSPSIIGLLSVLTMGLLLAIGFTARKWARRRD